MRSTPPTRCPLLNSEPTLHGHADADRAPLAASAGLQRGAEDLGSRGNRCQGNTSVLACVHGDCQCVQSSGIVSEFSRRREVVSCMHSAGSYGALERSFAAQAQPALSRPLSTSSRPQTSAKAGSSACTHRMRGCRLAEKWTTRASPLTGPTPPARRVRTPRACIDPLHVRYAISTPRMRRAKLRRAA